MGPSATYGSFTRDDQSGLNPTAFGISGLEGRSLDPQQKLVLHVGDHSLYTAHLQAIEEQLQQVPSGLTAVRLEVEYCTAIFTADQISHIAPLSPDGVVVFESTKGTVWML